MIKALPAGLLAVILFRGPVTAAGAAVPALLNLPLSAPERMVDLPVANPEETGLGRILSLAAGSATTAEVATALGRMVDPMRGTERAPRDIVRTVETAVAAAPTSTFAFDDRGFATLTAAGGRWAAGRFQIPRIATLRQQAPLCPPQGPGEHGCRLFVLSGVSPLADVAALQAFDDGETVFQVASQFNCLEAPGPSALVPVAAYFGDPTQGPRASISAFPGTFLRHYRAPVVDSPQRFVQVTGGPQVQLLGDTVSPTVARVQNGYLRRTDVSDPALLSAALTDHFDQIRVGLHEGVEVVRGFNWDGPVKDPHPRITQVFTSTFAGGGYSPGLQVTGSWQTSIRQLLKASYLATILSAVTLHRRRVLLTLVGGGVFGNPPEMIREAILQAMDEADTRGANLDVVVNLWDRSADDYLSAVRTRRGAIIVLTANVSLRR